MYNIDMSKLMPSYDAMLYQICKNEGIEMNFLCTNWVKQLKKDDKVRYINGCKFDVNDYAAGEIANDKCATYEVLKLNKIPAIEHELIYEFSNHAEYTLGRNSLGYVVDFFERHGRHIVVKPNRGMCGQGVIQVTDEQQLTTALVELFYGNSTLCMCPFYKMEHEHRVILLDGEVKLAYTKTLAKDNQWKFNLSCGARAEEMTQDKLEKVEPLAKKAAATLGLRFCSVDIAELSTGEMRVIEVNCGVMTKRYLSQHPDKYPVIEAMYHEAIRKMFE